MDIVDPETRSRMMAGIRSRDTAPELLVRRYLHAAGLRYRLQAGSLPGRPDIVLHGRKVAVFVHGCFWHQHPGCSKAKMPASRTDFWSAKFEQNRRRDEEATRALRQAGWWVETIWECEAGDELILDALLWRILARDGKRSREPMPDSARLCNAKP